MSLLKMTWMCGLTEKRLRDNTTGAGKPAPINKGVKMNIVTGINPKTNKKEIYKFVDTDKGFQEAQDKLSELDRLKYKKTGHEWKSNQSAMKRNWSL